VKLAIVILAAGQGTRMRSRLPKVLHPLAGRPLLGHVIDTARALGPARLLTVYGHGGGQVPAAFPGAPVTWVEQAEQRGTAHAVIQTLAHLGDADRVLVLYGDVPLIRAATLERLLAASADTGLGLLTARLADPSGYGRILRDGKGRILRIVEHKDASPEERAVDEINTGILVADRVALERWLEGIDDDNAQGEFYLTDVVGLAVAEGVRVASAAPDGAEEIQGVNDRIQLAALERQAQARTARALMAAGVTLADPARLDVRGTLEAGMDSVLDVDLVCEGRVVLGEGVRVGPGCVLRDCTLGDGVEVLAHTLIEEAEVGPGARVGPFARLRPGTRLAAHTHVGNFVEIKNSRVGEGSKLNHLTYVGDSDVGRRVNIGAGTITCNYDGAYKHRTVIGDDVFVGSDTQLVAPVRVGEGATIGAGSTITRDVPAGRLTLARARNQVTVEGWQRPRKPAPKEV